MSINSVSSMGTAYSQIASRGKGIGGIVSGLDTTELIKNLTVGTRSKIARQQQHKQTAIWKQQAYQSVITGMDAFRTKFLLTGSTNLRQNSTFNTFKASTASNAVNVKATANSSAGDIIIDQVVSVATAHSIQGKPGFIQQLQGDTVNLTKMVKDNDFHNKTLTITVASSPSDSVTKTIKLDSLNNLQIYNVGPIVFTESINPVQFEAELQRLVNEAFGQKPTASNPSVLENIVNVNVGGNFRTGFTIGLETGTGSVTINADNEWLGFKQNDSNRINTNTKLGEIDVFKGHLQGDTFKFTINGVNFSFKDTDSLQSMMNTINTSTANVRMTYNSTTGIFDMTSKTTGHANRIDMRDNSGNFLSTLFGAQGQSAVTSAPLYENTQVTAGVLSSFDAIYANFRNSLTGLTDAERTKAIADFGAQLQSYSFSLTIDGVQKTVNLNISGTSVGTAISLAQNVTSQDIMNLFNDSLKEAFPDVIGPDSSRVEFRVTGTGSDARISLHIPTTASGAVRGYILEDGREDGTDVNRNRAFDLLGFTSDNYTNHVSYANSSQVNAVNAINSSTNFLSPDTYSFKATVNGVTRNIIYTLTPEDIAYFAELDANTSLNATSRALNKAGHIASMLNEEAVRQFGMINGKPAITFGFNQNTQRVHATFAEGASVVMEASGISGHQNPLTIYGYTSAQVSNQATGISSNITLGSMGVQFESGGTPSLKINGQDVLPGGLNANTSLSQLVGAINSLGVPGVYAYFDDGRLVIDGGDNFIIEQEDFNIMQAVFGFNNINRFETNSSTSYNDGGTGTNAVIIVRGIADPISSNSNTITVNGTQVEVLRETATGETIKISVASDPSQLIDTLKDFIKDYNSMVSMINNMIREKAVKDYFPLSDEQKAEMTTEEIDRWNAEAIKGVMRNDPVLSRIQRELRDFLYDSVGPSGVSLHSIGITTVNLLYAGDSFAERNGHLELTADNEEKLRMQLEKNPDIVRELFTYIDDEPDPKKNRAGIGQKLDNAIQRAINPTTDPRRRGTLQVAVAGNPGILGPTASAGGLQNRIEQIDEAIEKLKAQLEREYDRYWKQFTAMETALSRMSMQSGWLTEFSSTNS